MRENSPSVREEAWNHREVESNWVGRTKVSGKFESHNRAYSKLFNYTIIEIFPQQSDTWSSKIRNIITCRDQTVKWLLSNFSIFLVVKCISLDPITKMLKIENHKVLRTIKKNQADYRSMLICAAHLTLIPHRHPRKIPQFRWVFRVIMRRIAASLRNFTLAFWYWNSDILFIYFTSKRERNEQRSKMLTSQWEKFQEIF